MTPSRTLRVSFRFWPLGALLFVFSTMTSAHGQGISPGGAAYGQLDPFSAASSRNTGVNNYDSYGGAMLFVTVFSDNFKTRLDRQSIIKLTNEGTQQISWQTTTSESEAEFGDLPFGKYEIEVSAVGYLPEHKSLEA